MVEFEPARFGKDCSLDVFMNEAGSDGKALGEKLDSTGVVGKSDKGDLAITPWDAFVMKDKGLRQ